jgi:hypothetical protein
VTFSECPLEHAAVHVVAGAGATVATLGDFVGGQASPDLRPAALGLVVG